MGEPRTSEVVSIVYFSALAFMAWRRPVAFAVRVRTCAMALLVTVTVIWVAGVLDPAWWRPGPSVRNWLPLPLLLLAYWLPGALVSTPLSWLERRLLALDRHLFRIPADGAMGRAPRVVRELSEAGYLAVYPMVPASFALLLASGRHQDVDWFWTLVLTSEYLCYFWLPLLPSRPPRELEPAPAPRDSVSGVRRLNLWIVDRASNRWNTFPSGHVAGAFACALAVLVQLPAAGVALLLLATIIAVASVAGRYHYAADALAGAAVAVLVFALLAPQ